MHFRSGKVRELSKVRLVSPSPSIWQIWYSPQTDTRIHASRYQVLTRRVERNRHYAIRMSPIAGENHSSGLPLEPGI